MSAYNEDQLSIQTIHIVYDGTPWADGATDVRDLAPALLSIGELCQEVNRQIYGSDSVVSVQVKADSSHHRPRLQQWDRRFRVCRACKDT